MSHKNSFLSIAALLSMALLNAQSPTPGSTPIATKNVPVATPVGAAAGDAILATWLHSACTNEIALAGIALKQAKSNDVRSFAQKLIDDHTAFAAKLQPFTLATAVPAKVGEGKPTKPTSGAGDGKNAAEASGVRAMLPADTFDHAGLIRDLAAKCLQSETKMLGTKTGAEFDRAFLQMQMASHQKEADMIEVFRTYSSEALRPTLDEGQKVIAAHRELATNLHHKTGAAVVEGSGGGR